MADARRTQPFMPPEVVALHEYLRDLIAAEHGPTKLGVSPVVIPTDTGGGLCTKVGGVWFIDAQNHGFMIETFRSGGAMAGFTYHRFRFWTHDLRRPVAEIEVMYRTADIPRADLRRYASQVGLLTAGVEREGAPT